MKTRYLIAIVAIGAALAAPVSAHHMSTDPEFVEEHMPADALDQHNLAVDEVLDMGVAEMAGILMGETSMTGETMDPADTSTFSGPENATDANALREPPTL